MPKPAELEAQLAQQLRAVQAQAAALVGAVSKGASYLPCSLCYSTTHALWMYLLYGFVSASGKARSLQLP